MRSMRGVHRLFLFGLVVVLLAGRADGEERPQAHALCWRGRPAPECRSFLITETGVLMRIDEYPYQQGTSRACVAFDLGWMKNVSRTSAIGLTGYALSGGPSTRYGARARYRHWQSRSTSVDLTAGILLQGEDNLIDYDPPGFVAGAALNSGDLISLTVEAEYAKYQDFGSGGGPVQALGRSDMTWRAGAKLGSGLGLVGGLALVGLTILIVASGGFQ